MKIFYTGTSLRQNNESLACEKLGFFYIGSPIKWLYLTYCNQTNFRTVSDKNKHLFIFDLPKTLLKSFFYILCVANFKIVIHSYSS